MAQLSQMLSVRIQGVPEKKTAQSLFCNRTLQSYAVSAKFSDKIVYTIKASVCIWQLNVLCFAAAK